MFSRDADVLLPQVEVFNLLFIKEHEKRHVVHCVDCARRHAPRLAGFICLEEYKLQELQDVFDNFQLHVVSGAWRGVWRMPGSCEFHLLLFCSRLIQLQLYLLLMSGFSYTIISRKKTVIYPSGVDVSRIISN